MQKSMMTSNRDDWETPKELYKLLNDIFHFGLDAAASDSNHKCNLYLTEQQNALLVDWDEYMSKNNIYPKTVFINPPYNNKGILLKFFNKIKEESDKGLTIVVLVAARTETRWHKIAWNYAKYFCFFYKRIQFELDGVPMGTPTFPSELIIFSKNDWDLNLLKPIAKILPNTIKRGDLYDN
jgi:phage N-6-adenine-methyltransferase